MTKEKIEENKRSAEEWIANILVEEGEESNCAREAAQTILEEIRSNPGITFVYTNRKGRETKFTKGRKMTAKSDEQNYYIVLGLDVRASKEELRKLRYAPHSAGQAREKLADNDFEKIDAEVWVHREFGEVKFLVYRE